MSVRKSRQQLDYRATQSPAAASGLVRARGVELKRRGKSAPWVLFPFLFPIQRSNMVLQRDMRTMLTKWNFALRPPIAKGTSALTAPRTRPTLPPWNCMFRRSSRPS